MNVNSPSRRSLTKEETEALEQFARLDISLGQLGQRLAGVMRFEFEPDYKRLEPNFNPPDPPIRIEKWHLNNALDKKRRGEVTQQQLADWASMLQLNEAYDWSGEDEDEIAEWLWVLADDIPATERD